VIRRTSEQPSFKKAFSFLFATVSLCLAQPAPGRIEWFQDQKFGLFLHWGAYSQMGCIESWPLVWADRSWSNPVIQTREQMVEFRQRYWALNRTFNPTEFDPVAWAAAAKRAGMKYVMFTTKHHDGFNMYDTRLTDYKVTGPDCPFSKDSRADVAKQIFEAFRHQGFAVGAYYSKADWRSPYYWRPDVFAGDRNPNYEVTQEPERWQKFVQFVHGQIEELMTRYGRIDILWLDAGQVKPPKQDIQMDRMVGMARRHQSHLIVVNRTAKDRYEDYRTPEQEVPEKPLDYPWESCLTMGKQWSYKPDDEYKSARTLIHLLVDIVAKGGNLLLNIGPQPDGKLPPVALSRLKEIGDWMAVNAEAIHGTRPIAPYKEGRVAFTSRGKTIYAIYLAEDGAEAPPANIILRGLRPGRGSQLRMLGVTDPLKWQEREGGVEVEVPSEVVKSPPSKHAFVFQFAR
jgi:alpha-L-fucosidase